MRALALVAAVTAAGVGLVAADAPADTVVVHCARSDAVLVPVLRPAAVLRVVALPRPRGEPLSTALASGNVRRGVAALVQAVTWAGLTALPHALDDAVLDVFDLHGLQHLTRDTADAGVGNTSAAALAALDPGLLASVLPSTAQLLLAWADPAGVTAAVAAEGAAWAAAASQALGGAAGGALGGAPVAPPGRVTLPAFGESFVAVRRRGSAAGLSARCVLQPLAPRRVALLLAGVALSAAAPSLARSAGLYYGGGAALGSLLALALLALLLARHGRRRSVWAPAAALGAASAVARVLGGAMGPDALRAALRSVPVIGPLLALPAPLSWGAIVGAYAAAAAAGVVCWLWVTRSAAAWAGGGGDRFPLLVEGCLRVAAAALLVAAPTHAAAGVALALALPLRAPVVAVGAAAAAAAVDVLTYVPGAGAAVDAMAVACAGRGRRGQRGAGGDGPAIAPATGFYRAAGEQAAPAQTPGELRRRAAFAAAAAAAVDDEAAAVGASAEARRYVRSLLASPHLERFVAEAEAEAEGGGELRGVLSPPPPPQNQRPRVRPAAAAAAGAASSRLTPAATGSGRGVSGGGGRDSAPHRHEHGWGGGAGAPAGWERGVRRGGARGAAHAEAAAARDPVAAGPHAAPQRSTPAAATALAAPLHTADAGVYGRSGFADGVGGGVGEVNDDDLDDRGFDVDEDGDAAMDGGDGDSSGSGGRAGGDASGDTKNWPSHAVTAAFDFGGAVQARDAPAAAPRGFGEVVPVPLAGGSGRKRGRVAAASQPAGFRRSPHAEAEFDVDGPPGPDDDDEDGGEDAVAAPMPRGGSARKRTKR